MKQALLAIILIGLAAGSFAVTAAEQTRSFAMVKMDCPVCPVTVGELAAASTNAGDPATLIQTDS